MDVEDMTTLQELSETSLVNNLKIRFNREVIYVP